MKRNWLLVLVLLVVWQCQAEQNLISQTVKPGINTLIEQNFAALAGKRVGLITNPTGVTANLKSTIDVLYDAENVELKAIFGPEHGARGNRLAGIYVESATDEKTGLPLYSLYGKTRKPTEEMLEDLDALVFDIQDAGYRAYTYIYTMAYAMEAAAEHNLAFYVLDRPNPLGADRVEGPVLDEQFKSFIGLYPIPYVYGMTVGELATYFNKEFNINADLTVIPMTAYSRSMSYAETGLFWVPTSPHVPRMDSPFFAATLGNIGELHTISEGVGFTLPFEVFGANFVQPEQLAEKLNMAGLKGVKFRPCYFRPYYLRNKGEEIAGVQMYITDAEAFSIMRTQLFIMRAFHQLYPEHGIFNAEPARLRMFHQAIGTAEVEQQIINNVHPDSIIAGWHGELKTFVEKRKKYLIY